MPNQTGGAVIDRFISLYAGNTRSSGRYDPKRDRSFTEPEPISAGLVQGHLDGKLGVGVVPIMDDDTCLWGAIDMDNHDTDEDLPLADIAALIESKGLPLVPCRSKSGGIHCYVFCKEPIAATIIKRLLASWADILGYGGCEIFPKQGKLSVGKADGKLQLGNWINLPYFDAGKTLRYAYREGKKLDIDEFLDLAEGLKITKANVKNLLLVEHPEAPPCVRKMLVNGVAQGMRNEGLYNIVVYLKKADPTTAEAKAQALAASVFSKPLPKPEATRTINSAMRPECAYRCGEEPARSLCDRETCLKRKYGITPDDAEKLATNESLPAFTDLVKYMTEPVRWEVKIDGVKVLNLGTGQLLEWRSMREIIADRLTKIVPLIKNSEWERILQPLMQSARIIETPDDASVNGVIRDRLREFAAKTDLTSRGEDKGERSALLRGMPVVQVHDGERCVMFRGQDFVNYLKRTKSEELKGVNLWFAVKEIGVEHTRIRIGSKDNINVWYLPIREVLHNTEELEPVEFKPEL